MGMEELKSEVTLCVLNEYSRASAQYGATNNSDHESYAIILEEFEETKAEIEEVEKELATFWNLTMLDHDDYAKFKCATVLMRRAISGACELIQVGAMARKAAVTLMNRGNVLSSARKENSEP